MEVSPIRAATAKSNRTSAGSTARSASWLRPARLLHLGSYVASLVAANLTNAPSVIQSLLNGETNEGDLACPSIGVEDAEGLLKVPMPVNELPTTRP